MAQKEYNPRVNNYQPETGLRSAVSSAQIYSYDEKRPDTVWENRNAGDDWRQLARALSSFQPTLAQYAEDKQVEDNKQLTARATDIAMQQRRLGKTLEETIQQNPGLYGKYPVAMRAGRRVYLQGDVDNFQLSLKETSRNEGWVNLPPEEFTKKADAFTQAHRESLAQKAYGEDAAPEIASVYLPGVEQARSALNTEYSNERTKIEFAKRKQEFSEGFMLTTRAAVSDPDNDFFNLNNVDHNLQELGSRYTENIMTMTQSGLPLYLAQSQVLEDVSNFALVLADEATGADDLRPETYLEVAEHISTPTGLLGDTPEWQAQKVKLLDDINNRRDRQEAREKKTKAERQEKATGVFLKAIRAGQNNLAEVAAENGLNVDDAVVAEAAKNALTLSAAISQTPETPQNRAYYMAALRGVQDGTVSYLQIEDDHAKGLTTEKQRDKLLTQKQRFEGKESGVGRLADDAGLPTAVKELQNVFGKVGPDGEALPSDGVGPEGALVPLISVRKRVASALFENTARAEIQAIYDAPDLSDNAKKKAAEQAINNLSVYFNTPQGLAEIFNAADDVYENSGMYPQTMTKAQAILQANAARNKQPQAAANLERSDGAGSTDGPDARDWGFSPDSVLSDIGPEQIKYAEVFEKEYKLPPTSVLTAVAGLRSLGLPVELSSAEDAQFWAEVVYDVYLNKSYNGNPPTPIQLFETLMPGYTERAGAYVAQRNQERFNSITANVRKAFPDIVAVQKALESMQSAGTYPEELKDVPPRLLLKVLDTLFKEYYINADDNTKEWLRVRTRSS